jgi:cellulose biosynthesis protein BcsQ
MVTAVIQPFLDTIVSLRRKKLNPRLTVDGIVLTRVDPRTTLVREIVEGLRASLDGNIPILGEVRASIRLQEATALHQLLTRYRPAADAIAPYRQIAEVMRHVRQRA